MAAVYLQRFQNFATPYAAQAKAIAQTALAQARKYVTVEAPNPDADYFSNDTKIVDLATKQMAIQRETLVREKTRWSHVANVGAGAAGTVGFIGIGHKLHNLILAIGAFGLYKGAQYAKERISGHFDPQIAALDQRIAQRVQGVVDEPSGKKTE